MVLMSHDVLKQHYFSTNIGKLYIKKNIRRNDLLTGLKLTISDCILEASFMQFQSTYVFSVSSFSDTTE